jgi:large subunit ribosomal protein L25
MATQTITLETQERVVLGKKVKLLRSAGIVPVHLYGASLDSQALQCEQRPLVRALAAAGSNTPIMLYVEGKDDSVLTFAREIQWDPRTDTILHVDFLAVDATALISALVPTIIVGEAPGARAVSGQVSLLIRELMVQALPLEMPMEIEIDATLLTTPESVIRREDINISNDVELIGEPDVIVARIVIPRAAVSLGDETSDQPVTTVISEETTETEE